MDREPDPIKQTAECRANETRRCPNKQSRETWDAETVWCDICGLHYRLYDDDMK